MPELPEAEVARKTLTPCVVGRIVNAVLVARPQSIRTPLTDVALFSAWLKDRRIESIERRAKALIFFLSGEMALVFHFKLGADVLCKPEAVAETNGVALNFTDGTCLDFTDLALSEFHLVENQTPWRNRGTKGRSRTTRLAPLICAGSGSCFPGASS